MFSRLLQIHFRLVAVALFFVLLLQTVSAAPAPEPVPAAEPDDRTPGKVAAENKNLACYAGACYYTTNHTAVQNTTDASTVPINSTEGSPAPAAANSAMSLRSIRTALPLAAAGTSLLFIL